MDTYQFYPTPDDLARKMISKFVEDPFSRDARIIEPSAGNGALVKALVAERDRRHDQRMREYGSYWRADPINVDFIEVDMSKHSTLLDIEGVKGQIVGLDFLQFSGALSSYSHVLMNPPFNAGVHHVLKAWDGLYDGEIVSLLNAETIRNPFSKERVRLVNLIENHGDVEFVQGAFKGDGVERQSDVEVAIVHLVKKADLQADVIGHVLDSLQDDPLHDTGGSAFPHLMEGQELAIPGDVIEITVRTFNAAVKAMRESVIAQARSSYLSRLVGKTMAQHNGGTADQPENIAKTIRDGIRQGYKDLKDRAWSSVLTSTKVSNKLSSGAQQRLMSDFERIKRLDFSVANVYSFLIGLIESQSDMHLQMACDIFDDITKYHEDNSVWYMGWKSNDKHRTAGRRIKMTRFILPGFEGSWSRSSIGYQETMRLSDFDKVFEVLDGKQVGSSYGLAKLFSERAKDLANGKRLASDYFEVRWYPGRGTVHFFPKRKDLIDRLNRLVGRTRQWLPEREDMVSKDFWLAYEQAEKFDDAIRSMVAQEKGWRNPFWVASARDGKEAQDACDTIAKACLKVAQDHGLDPLKGLEHASAQPQALLLEAA